MQGKRHSIVEALCNTGSGFVIAYFFGQFIVYPLLGVKVSASENFWSTCIFTVVSIVRSYVWRRLFNKNTFDAHIDAAYFAVIKLFTKNKNNNKGNENL